MSGVSIHLTINACRALLPYVKGAQKKLEVQSGRSDLDIQERVRPLVVEVTRLAEMQWRQLDAELRFKPGDERDRDSATVLRFMLIGAIKALRARASRDDANTLDALKLYLTMLDGYLDTPPVERIAALAEG